MAPSAKFLAGFPIRVATLGLTQLGAGHSTRLLAVGRVAFVYGNVRKFLLQDEEMSTLHEVSIILTFAMGSPNDDRRFFKLSVTPQEAERFLPSIPGASIPGEGPVLQVRVGAPRAVARFVWNDALAPNFYRAFAGRQNRDGEEPSIGDPVNLEQLQSYAQAVAAKEAARYRDHPEGAPYRASDA